MKKITLDLETYSSVDLSKSGVYKYAESEDFEILLFAYAIDDEDIQVIDLASGEDIPDKILHALEDDKVEKWAFNANFERVCLSRYLGRRLNPKSWYCSMVWSAYLGLPLSLEKVAEVLRLDTKKMAEGRSLIRTFSIPVIPTKSNGYKSRLRKADEPEKWELFKEYNKKDVEVERAINKKLSVFPMPDFEWENYHIDQVINDRGICVDLDLVKGAVDIDEKLYEKNMKRAMDLTGLENPNSPLQLREWLKKEGLEMDSLAKKEVDKAIKESTGKVREALLLRRQLSKSSIRKFNAIKNVATKDKKVRGLIQFYGANRTGRYAGRLIQVQNLRRNNLDDLELARSIVKDGDYELLSLLYDSPADILSQLIRTAFVPSEGRVLLVSDFSAIEARVLSWLSGETWRMETFNRGVDIYCESASQMFGVPVEKHGINGHLRQKGKIAELACGYQGSVGALKAMGGLDMGLSEEELQSIVDSWREANPNIVNLWYEIDSIVKAVIKSRGRERYKNLLFSMEKGILFITLPSKRRLAYMRPGIGMNRFGGESITYEFTSTGGKWERQESYGGKFVENIVQAIARDILASSLKRLNKKYDIVMHVHDEVVIDGYPKDLEDINKIMCQNPSWAKGLVLDAEGFVCDFYRKD